jgi:uncharacterized protein YdiU (UPF0061 family)
MRGKLGLDGPQAEDAALVDDLLSLLQAQHVDLTSCFRALSRAVLGDTAPARSLFPEPAAFDAWSGRWRDRVTAGGRDPREIARSMDRVNPAYIPRNHKVEEALAAAVRGDIGPFDRLVDVLTRPFDERPGLEPYAAPAPPSDRCYRTFCGT